MIPDTGTVLSKWKSRTTAASQDYVNGANATDKDPTALAIAAIPRMKANINAAIDNGTVANGLRRAGKTGWLEGINSKGAANFTNGVNGADAKFSGAFDKLLTAERTLQSQILSMPNVTDQDRKNRMTAWFDGLVGKSFKA